MIVLGDRVRIRVGGETGTVIRTFINPVWAEKLLLLRLDAQDRYGCAVTTEWESAIERIEEARREA